MHPNNIVLIGMPGAGKSTLGVLLAKKTSKNFVDTDLLIQLKSQSSLQDIVNDLGYLKLREIEERVLLSLDCNNHVIATGGSAVYSEKAMQHLRKNSLVVYLKISLHELKMRVQDYSTRGIACKPGENLQALYLERQGLYEKFADITISCDNKTPEQVLMDIEAEIN
ncbi:shikimate kinase [Aurantivibrio infirmus]